MAEAKKLKPGWQSTELYLIVAAALFGALLAAGVFTPEGGCVEAWCAVAQTVVGGIVTLLSALGYQWTRSKLKAKELEPGK